MKNFEVKVRGPFDIASRMIYLPSMSSSESETSRPPSQNSHGFYKGHGKKSIDIQENPMFNNILNSKRSGVLLNKERGDLCWDVLFMVCGGTGITPMLQLVSYKFYFIL